ncbi:DivIVA domain-containing protein [Actinoplanes sp. NBC_00393]|uniref:DivIVA domain-containing protein n=1 Tax=Actinoplanes sp. NBC_00393 TaxID=2975953 RepID=UPI002E1B4213
MSLTPADIHNTEFAKAPLGRRGYDGNDVDCFLDEAIGEMIRLLEENEALRHRLDARAPVRASDGPRRVDRAELSAATAALGHAQRACDRAEREARHVRKQFDEAYRAAAAAATVRGEASPERVLRMAQHTADGYVGEARDKSRMLLTEAREQAGRVLRDARDAAAAIDRRSHDQQNEAATDLATGRARMVRDIDDLTRLAAGYHSALKRHLHHQGGLIDGTAGK